MNVFHTGDLYESKNMNEHTNEPTDLSGTACVDMNDVSRKIGVGDDFQPDA